MSPVERADLDDWPGKERREPRRGTSTYLMYRVITRSLTAVHHRYLRTGLRVLDIGCGVQPWRWTQQGFVALLADADGLELVQLVPHGGSASTVAVIVNTSIREAGKASRLSALGVPLIALINGIGATIHRALPARAKAALIPNFLAVARRV